MPDPDTTNPQDSLLAFFETLCPTQEIILTVNGKRYAFPTSLPARRQQATIAKMLKILDLGIVGDIPKLEGLPPSEMAGRVLSVVKRMVGEGAVLTLLSEALETAYPAQAKELLASDSEAKDLGDVLSLDEMIGLLVPLVVRLVTGLRDQYKSLRSPSL